MKPARLSTRRKRTRVAILDAARRLWSERGVADTSVEDLLVEARIARATFYDHFADKNDVARAIVAGIWSNADEMYAEFAALPSIDEGAVRAWLTDAHRRWRIHYQEVSTVLHNLPIYLTRESGLHSDAFVTILIGDGRHWRCPVDEARCRAHLLIVQLERAMLDFHSGTWRITEETLTATLTDIWLRTTGNA